ncbi:MAG: GNAT family N-acetyltransferase [Desulfobacterales bacterium]|nr:GNAT family N-acetyltransferase [Desulfobacterales bacterium]
MKKVLVVAAHPDDEILGCGGTIARHIEDGYEVHVAIMAEGVTSRDVTRDTEMRGSDLAFLSDCANHAHKILGSTSLVLHNFPDNRMDSVDLLDIIKVIEGLINQIKPEIVYTHCDCDLNIDHRITHQAVATACRPAPGRSIKKLISFEVPSSTEWQSPVTSNNFIPNYFIDISRTINQKLLSLEAYRSEMRDWPHPRSYKAVENLARYRGSTVGFEAAESFMLIRELIFYPDKKDKRAFKGLHLIPAGIENADMILEWRNDIESRRASTIPDIISREDHIEWLEKSLQMENRKIFIAVEEDTPVGVVRADFLDGEHELSWTVSPDFRDRGLGKKIVSLLVTSLSLPVSAKVNKNNKASIKIAEYAGMKKKSKNGDMNLYRRDVHTRESDPKDFGE